MKKTLLAFLIIIFFSGTLSCQERNKVELIPNTEKEYVYIKGNPWETDRPEVLSFSYKQIKNINIAARKVGQEISEDQEFEYALFINEDGYINKLKPLKSFSRKIDDLLIEEMSNWKMQQHLEKKIPTKYRIDWHFSIKSGLFKNNVMGAISSNFPIIDQFLGKEYFVSVDEMPQPIGGIKSIQDKIVYPESAKREGVEGRVFIKAYIDEKGNVMASKIIKGIDNRCNIAASEALQKVKFKPASLKGKPVGAQVTVPILFKLDSKKRTEIEKNRATIAKEEIERVKLINEKNKK